MQELKLPNAYATWVRGEDNNQWIVRDKNNKELARFPAHWKEKDCMVAIKFGRKFEGSAFNIGTNAGIIETNKKFNGVLKQTDEHIRYIEEQNERLSNKLEKMIIGKED